MVTLGPAGSREGAGGCASLEWPPANRPDALMPTYDDHCRANGICGFE